MVAESSNKKNDGKVRKTERVPNPPGKIVVRKLPPTFTDEDFKNAIAPIPEHNYFYFATGDKSLGSHSYSRAYISFSDPEEILVFRDKFDGYVFVDQKGNEYPAIVEYAPFQKVPKVFTHVKKDPRCGTIDEDADYVSFLELLKNPETVVLPQIENILEEIENHEKELKANNGVLKVKTPLLEYVEQRAIDRLRPGDKRRRKEFDRKRAREEEKRRRKDIKEYRKKDEQRLNLASNSTLSYRERQKRREEERQRISELREKEKKERRAAKESSKFGSGRTIEEKEADNVRSSTNEDVPSFKSKRYSEARKKEDRDKKRESVRESKPSANNQESESSPKEIEDEQAIEAGTKDDSQPVKSETSFDNQNEDPKIVASENAEDSETVEDKPNVDSTQKDIGSLASLPTEDVEPGQVSEDGTKEEPKEMTKKPDENESETTDKDENVCEDQKDSNHYRDASTDSQNQSKKDEKDPRTERRIRNKDRPAMQLYRPGQSRLSSRAKQSTEEEFQERGGNGDSSSSSSPSPIFGKGEHHSADSKEGGEQNSTNETSYKEKPRLNDNKSHHDKRGQGHRESRGGYFWESEWDKDNYGKPKDEYEEGQSRPARKGYSYHHERESKGKRTSKNKEQDNASS